MYNQYNLEADPPPSENILLNFRKFLTAEKIHSGSIRSYLSDVRHFFSWLTSFFQTTGLARISDRSTPISENLNRVNESVLNAYKDFLESNNIPPKTINRRFSSLRKFGAFCLDQKICSKNPFDTLRNIPQKGNFPENEFYLSAFFGYLWKNNNSKLTIKNYINDVKQFLAWSKNNF